MGPGGYRSSRLYAKSNEVTIMEMRAMQGPQLTIGNAMLSS